MNVLVCVGAYGHVSKEDRNIITLSVQALQRLSAHSFTSNGLLFFLNQRKGGKCFNEKRDRDRTRDRTLR